MGKQGTGDIGITPCPQTSMAICFFNKSAIFISQSDQHTSPYISHFRGGFQWFYSSRSSRGDRLIQPELLSSGTSGSLDSM